MNKEIKVVRTVAIVSLVSILAFQISWTYSSYQSGRRDLRNNIGSILQGSVDGYQLRQSVIPMSLDDKKPYLSVLSEITGVPVGSGAKSLVAPKKNAFNVKLQPLRIDAENLAAVRLFIAKMLARPTSNKISISTIRENFQKVLHEKELNINFILKLHDAKWSSPEGSVVAYFGPSKTDLKLEAVIINENQYLFTHNLSPLLVSLFLVLLTSLTLWYMWITIARQKEIDRRKNDFIGNITHELRTPVTIMKSINEALLGFGVINDVEKSKKYLNVNAGILDNLNSNIDRLLEVSVYDSGIIKPAFVAVDIQAISKRVIDIFKSAGKGEIRLLNDTVSAVVNTDPVKVETIVMNLVDNAFKYSGNDPYVEIRLSSTKKFFIITVKDNGPGIPDDFKEQVFEKFFRVPTGHVHEVKGYGIGLHYTKLLTENIGGKITLESGKTGSSFTIHLPL